MDKKIDATTHGKQQVEDEVLLTQSYSFWQGTFIIHGSVLTRIIYDVLAFGAFAVVAILVSRYLSRTFAIDLSIPTAPFQVAGAVLGFLLVLRLNAGHSRWWEARKLWGGIINQSRNLAILGLAYGSRDHNWRVEFIKWVATFPHVARRSLRDEHQALELNRLLTTEELAWLVSSTHMPNAVSKRIATLLDDVNQKPMSGFAFQEAERQRSMLLNHLGGCERILKTPIARSSAIQVRQFIFVFLILLPFSLLQDLGAMPNDAANSTSTAQHVWLVPFFMMLIAYMLLALDRIGMELQNPFDPKRLDFLPLDEICVAIEKNLLELLHDDSLHTYAAPTAADVELPPDASTQANTADTPADIS